MTNRARAGGVLVFLLAGVLLLGGGPAGAQMDLAATQYYVSSLGEVALPLSTLIQTAQASGFTTIVRSGDVVTGYLGKERTDLGEEVLLTTSPLLYVDGDLFVFQVRGPDLDYVVRPAQTGYALLLIPQRSLASGEVLPSVLRDLRSLGIAGDQAALGFTAVPRGLEKAPPPPQGVALDSALYGLTLAEDWFTYAAANGLTRVGLRVEVVAEKRPGEVFPESFRAYVVSETAELAKLLVPIHRLVELARSAAISYVRPPYQPAPQVP